MVKRNVIEMVKFAKDSLEKEEGFSGVVSEKEKVRIFVHSRTLYDEIKDPFEKYGYEVYCGRKKHFPKRRR